MITISGSAETHKKKITACLGNFLCLPVNTYLLLLRKNKADEARFPTDLQ